MFAFLENLVGGGVARWLGRSERKWGGRAPAPRRARPALEALEDRLTPAVAGVTGSPPVQFTAGMTLTPGQSVSSNNGQFTLILQGDGNLVEYNNATGQALFTSNTEGQTVTDLTMQSDGNLVLYNGSTPVFASNTDGHSGAFLEIRDDAKLVITSGNHPFWARGMSQPFTLSAGQAVFSANGQNFLVMQSDGNLVEYNSSGQVLFATNTAGSGATQATMQSDGNFVLYTADGTPVFATNTDGHPGAWLNVLDNGNVNIYHGKHKLFSSHSASMSM